MVLRPLAWGLISRRPARQPGCLICVLSDHPSFRSVTYPGCAVKSFDVITFQAEDEIAAVCAAIGASFAGSLGVTSSAGPGIALKQEAISLAVSAELPLVVVNTQRGGPSTGLPTKTEQSDLLQAIYGRHGDTPLPVVASSPPGRLLSTLPLKLCA